MADLAASIPCFTPQQVPVSELLDGPPPAVSVALPSCSAPPLPTGPCPVCPRLAAEFEPWRQAAYWKSRHQRSVAREHVLQQENQQFQARIRYLEQQLFGRKSEVASATAQAPPDLKSTANAIPAGPPR